MPARTTDPQGLALAVVTSAFNPLLSDSHTIRFAEGAKNWSVSVQVCETVPFQVEFSPRLRGALVRCLEGRGWPNGKGKGKGL